jgi:hypothetical protein
MDQKTMHNITDCSIIQSSNRTNLKGALMCYYLLIIFLVRSDENPTIRRGNRETRVSNRVVLKTKMGPSNVFQINLVCDVPQECLGGWIAHLKLESIEYITLHLNNLHQQEVNQVNFPIQHHLETRSIDTKVS